MVYGYLLKIEEVTGIGEYFPCFAHACDTSHVFTSCLADDYHILFLGWQQNMEDLFIYENQ